MIQLLVKVAIPLRSPTCKQAFVLFVSYEEIVNCFSLVTFKSMNNSFDATKQYSDTLIQLYASGQVVNCLCILQRQQCLRQTNGVSL
jgi:hypothetical protein